jgi:hypothetical protein
MWFRQRFFAVIATVAMVASACSGGSSAPVDPNAPDIRNVTLTSAASGINPALDGFSFPNFAAAAVNEEFNTDDMVTMFGNGSDICVDGAMPCELTAEASGWARMVNQARSSGHCEGLAVLSQERFNEKAIPKTFSLNNTADVSHAIMRAFSTQFLNEVQSATKSYAKMSMREIVTTLAETLKKGKSQYTLGVYTDTGGHAILPYAIETPSKDKAIVKVYDSNWPGKDRFVAFDLAKDTWEFSFSGQDPNNDPNIWQGGKGDVDLSPIQARTQGSCPFCGSKSAVGKSTLLIRSSAPDWSIESKDGALKPGSYVQGNSVVRPLRSGRFNAESGKNAAPTDFLISTDFGTGDVKLRLKSAAQIVGITPTSTFEVASPSNSSSESAPIILGNSSIQVDNPNITLTLAQENFVASSTGSENVLSTSSEGIKVQLVTEDGTKVEVTTSKDAPSFEIRTSEAPGGVAGAKYELAKQVGDNQIETTVVKTDGTKVVKTEVGVLDVKKTTVELPPELEAPPTKGDLPPPVQRDLSIVELVAPPPDPPSESIVKDLASVNPQEPLATLNDPQPGRAISVQYSGFRPGEWVQLIVASTPQVLSTVKADGSGTVRINAALPNDLDEGDHHLVIYRPALKMGIKQPFRYQRPLVTTTTSTTTTTIPKTTTTTTIPKTTTTTSTTTTIPPTTTTSTSTTTTTTSTTTTTIPPVVASFNPVRNLQATANLDGSVQLDWTAPIATGTPVDKYMISFYDLDQIGGTTSGGWGIYIPGNNTTFTFDSSMFTGSNPVTTGLGPVRFEVYAADANWFYGPRTSVDATVLDPNATTTTTTTLPPPNSAEWGVANEGDVLSLTAPTGQVFTEILFASFGTPTGQNGRYETSGCNASNSVQIASSVFLGRNQATLSADNGVFGDPCGGTYKWLAVTAAYGPAPTTTTTSTTTTTTTLAPQVPPSAPLALSSTKGTNAVSLTWNVPTTTGSAAISDYVVSYSQSAAGSYTVFNDGVSTDTMATVTGLTNGSSYYFKVAAVSSAGTGALTSATPAVAPAQPCSSSCVVGDIGPGGGIIFITPATSGNSSGEFFEAAPNNWNGGSDPNIAWCNNVSTSISGSTGTSIGSGKTNTAAVASACTTGASDTAIAYSGGGLSDWFLPSIDELLQMYTQRVAIGGFKESRRGSTTILTATYWSSTQNSATQARNWSFADNGNDNWSKSLGFNVRPVRSFSAPSQPLPASASSGDAEAELTWSAPSSSNGSSITDYVVKYSTTSGGPYTTFDDGVSTSRTTTVTGLSNGVAYYFIVSAVNAAGTGSASAESAAVTPLAPAPVITSITGSNGQIDVSWGAVNHGGDNYQIWWGTDPTWESSFTYTGTTNTTYNISGLVNGTTYYVRVAGWNNSLSPQVGTTTWSTNASAVPAAPTPPSTPTSISAESVFLGENLVVNPGAESGTDGWVYTGDWYVGPGWKTPHSGTQSVSTSYTLATRTQTVSLSSETTAYLDTSPDIEVSTWFHGLCATQLFMVAELLDSTGNILATQNIGSSSSLVSNMVYDLRWEKRTLRFSGYPAGVRSVRYTDGGQDGCGWAGYYGVAMDDTSVKVRQPSVSGIAQVNLSWATAGLNGGSAITDYIVEYATSSGGTFRVYNDGVHAGTSASVNGLPGGNTYYFRVKAVNSDGPSGASSETYGVHIPAMSATSGVNVVGYTTTDYLPTRSDAVYESCGSGYYSQIIMNWDNPADYFGTCGSEDYMLHFQGRLTLPTGTPSVRFMVLSDDGADMRIAGTQFSSWSEHGCDATVSDRISPSAGSPLPFDLWFYERSGGTCLELYWQLGDDTASWDLVPASAFTRVASCAEGGPCAIGDVGPGGGIVFSVQSSPINAYSGVSSGGIYLEYGQESSGVFGCRGGLSTGYGLNIGQGAENTGAFSSICTASNATTVLNLVEGGKSDWFLPSKLELNELCKFARNQWSALGTTAACDSSGTLRAGFTAGQYWSSSAHSGKYAYRQNFTDGTVANPEKWDSYQYRPIRAFGS